MVFSVSFAIPLLSSARPFLVLDETTSPDGKYAVGWGVPYTELEEGNLGDQLSTLNLDAVENYLVDLERDEILGVLDSAYFPGKNRGGIFCIWREDSGAVFVIELARFGYLNASVSYLVDPEDTWDPFSDTISVTKGMRRTVLREIEKRHPEEKESIADFYLSLYPKKWTGAQEILFEVTGEVPKNEEAFFFEGEMTLALAGPQTVSLPGEVSTPEGQGSGRSAITADSVGPIALGMTIGEARTAMPSAQFQRRSDGEGIALVSVIEEGEEVMSLFADELDPDSTIDDSAVIQLIEVWSDAFVTKEGVHVGMTVAEAEKRIGDVRAIYLSEIESREYADFARPTSGASFRLGHPSSLAGDYPDGEFMAKNAIPGAVIRAIEVRGADIMIDGVIGELRLNMTSAEVLAIAEDQGYGEAFRGKDEIWEAFGQAVQSWIFPEAGISLDMISDEIGGAKSVLSITVKPPFSGRTARGIALGDPRDRVVEAYAGYKTEETELDGFFPDEDVHLVGSIYGGMIFKFTNLGLSEIFLGAAAE